MSSSLTPAEKLKLRSIAKALRVIANTMGSIATQFEKQLVNPDADFLVEDESLKVMKSMSSDLEAMTKELNEKQDDETADRLDAKLTELADRLEAINEKDGESATQMSEAHSTD